EDKIFIPSSATFEEGSGNEHGSSHEHLHRTCRIRVEFLPAIPAVSLAENARPAEQARAMQQCAYSRPQAIRNLRLALPVAKSRADDAGFRMRAGEVQQTPKRSGRNLSVVVQEEDITALCQSCRLVVGAGETKVGRIADEDDFGK